MSHSDLSVWDRSGKKEDREVLFLDSFFLDIKHLLMSTLCLF